MLKNRKELDDYLAVQIKSLSKKQGRDTMKALVASHNMDRELATDIVTMNRFPEELDTLDCFCVLETLNRAQISRFFTEAEIKHYSGEKYEADAVIKELKFDVVRISDDQYIGRYSAKELMQLRKNSLINYNANTQRALSYSMKGGQEVLRIAINRTAVSQIVESLRKQLFIPNTITLNINDENDADFEYTKKGELVIHDPKPLDILDGFHRYLALAQLYDEDNSFDYDIELRIVNFSEERAKQFIYQEDQKTKMPRVTSNAYDQNDLNNILCGRLNTDTSFAGEITVNGKVNAGIFAAALNIFDIKSRADIKPLLTKFKRYFEEIMDEEPDIIEHKWNNYEIQCLVWGVSRDLQVSELLRMLRFHRDTPAEVKKRYSKTWKLTKKDQKVLEEVRESV